MTYRYHITLMCYIISINCLVHAMNNKNRRITIKNQCPFPIRIFYIKKNETNKTITYKTKIPGLTETTIELRTFKKNESYIQFWIHGTTKFGSVTIIHNQDEITIQDKTDIIEIRNFAGLLATLPKKKKIDSYE